MGLCCSKKQPPPDGPGATSKKKPGKVAAAAIADDKAKKTVPQTKNSVRTKAAAAGEETKKKRAPHEETAPKQLPVVLVPSAPVRTSSCTKEEVDAILIQCGRLSRSSSGTGRAASGETGGEGSGHRRRRSGSKRSYDFDQERKAAAGGGGDDEGDWERQGVPVSRPSPHRGSPQRKRSGSRERSGGGGGGSRRASRSPGRRSEGGVSSAAMAGSGGGERARQQQQPGKMVSVPAREKGRAPSPAAASGIRCASPRSSSPARMAAVGNENDGGRPAAAGPTPALSRSSSRKAEQSPYRRNPMAELDENTLRNNNVTANAKPLKKSTEDNVAVAHQKAAERGNKPIGAASCRSGKEKPEIAEDATVAASEARPNSAKTSATRTASVAAESLTQRPATCRSRRASRDFDQSSNNSYASQILEDIQSYHEQHQSTTSAGAPPATPSFTLPACVAKACSILEAVADLNSSSSSDGRTFDHHEPGRSADDRGSVNALSGRAEPSARGRGQQHVLPAVRDLRAEAAEPQESAGSNSVSGIPWTPSWEPTSVESSDRTWSAGDEVVDQAVQAGGSHGAPSPMNRPRQGSKQRPAQPEPSGRSRAGSGNGNSFSRGRSAHRGSASAASGRSGVRTVSAAS